MEPALIAHLATLGYKITQLGHDEYGCTLADGSLMDIDQQEAVRRATQKWLVNRYYH